MPNCSLMSLLLFFYKTILLPVVLYGCEKSSFINGGMHGMGILEQDLGLKMNENGELRRCHSEELHALYHSPNTIRIIKCRILRKAEWAAARKALC